MIALVLFVAVSASGCMSAPEPRVERALYLDLRQVVELRQRADWVVDRLEVEDLAQASMRSICRVSAAERASTLRWIEAEIEAEGGSAKAVFEASGGDLDAVAELLTLERVLLMLQDGHARAGADCPFWLAPEADFAGVHSSADRFLLLLESRGGGALWILGDEVAFGGSGGGRLLFGWGAGDHFSAALGLEVGGGGLISSDSEAQSINATFNSAVPLLLRYHDSSFVFDVELAAVNFSLPSDINLLPGGRVALGVGLRTPRVSAFMPGGMLQLGYELHPERGDFPVTHIVFVGTRVGVEAGW